mgnify:CR=1 FL=1
MSLASLLSIRLPLVQQTLKQNKLILNKFYLNNNLSLSSAKLLSTSVAQEKAVYKRDKPHLNIGTIGHVDHGKIYFIKRLLFWNKRLKKKTNKL